MKELHILAFEPPPPPPIESGGFAIGTKGRLHLRCFDGAWVRGFSVLLLLSLSYLKIYVCVSVCVCGGGLL